MKVQRVRDSLFLLFSPYLVKVYRAELPFGYRAPDAITGSVKKPCMEEQNATDQTR